MRFTLTEVGAEQLKVMPGRGVGPHPRSAGGVVLRKSGDCWVIRFDNRKTAIRVSKRYVTIKDDPVIPTPGQ